jgi:phage tail protein X
MFTKISRYSAVPGITVPDSQGRVLPAKDIRLLPAVTGTFQHLVSQGDRLDQLAYTYYGQPLDWWHISDANPGILSPLALLGDEPVTTIVLPVTPASGTPSSAGLLRGLGALAGVEQAEIQNEVQYVAQAQQVGGQNVTVTVERLASAVQVTFNSLVTPPDAIGAAITAAGFKPGAAEQVGQVGQQIIIPPPLTG